MNTEELRLIRDCLPEGRTKYYYFKDAYLFQILKWKLGEAQATASSLKQHAQWQRFAKKEAFARYLSKWPDGLVDGERLGYYWPSDQEVHAFRLTLGEWGQEPSNQNDSWFQTSRSGWNLVLQLNFPAEHDREYRNLVGPDGGSYFAWTFHPVRVGQFNTLAWARLDIDLDRGVALIEEIQTDWLREAADQRSHLAKELKRGQLKLDDRWWQSTVGNVISYFDRNLEPLLDVWDEAMLSAALWFLYKELGVSRVYYHTWESGLLYKQLTEDSAPPRSLYTKLPKRFGFEKVEMGPSFLDEAQKSRRFWKRRKDKRTTAAWWRLDLEPAIQFAK
ncbi:hypothetical protein [Cerasicoccus frondis]|uniref:hypothetical protein n=1 Tax=Cerasicoccus frondis TaxID=490090 RepID=UPI0028528D9B|nr:hypothetical protein [Cerasicoccus frondis]